MRVNELGLRGPLVAVPKSPGTFRIACIGDSHTFGDGVGEQQTWPAHLEQALRERWPGGELEVLNCGVNGYDSIEELVWLERYVLPTFELDAVLWQYFVNDANSSGNRRQRDRWLEWTAPQRAGWLGALRSGSRTFELVTDAIQRQRGLRRYVELRSGGYEAGSPGWISVTESLCAADRLLSERGVSFHVLLFPFLLERDGQLASHASLARVREFCELQGLACFDGESVFLGSGQDLDELRVSPHDYHANDRAYRMFAQALAEGL